VTWTQTYTPIAGSLGVSVLFAALPLVVVAIMLGVFRSPAWRAATLALLTALAVAILVYGMPVPLAAMSAIYGGVFGLFPIGWLVYSAILLFDIAVESGSFAAIERSLRRVSGDQRMLVLLIAFAFGAFIEGTSGFGTPVAVSASLLAALGIPAFTAAGLCLVANTAPVAFGALATPIVTLAGVTGLPLMALSSAVGRLSPIIAVIIPAYLMVLMAGWRNAMGVMPAALACGLAFAIAQFLVSNYIGPYLTDILSALAAAVALLIAIRFFKPADETVASASLKDVPLTAAAHGGSHPKSQAEPEMSLARAWLPYILLSILVLIWGAAWTVPYLNRVSIPINVPLLHNAIERVPPVTASVSRYPAVFNFNWLASGGTATFIAAILSAVLLGIPFVRFLQLMGSVFKRLFVPLMTIAAVLALAYVMNYSGATATLGLALAGTGVVFPFFSAFLGWLGVFLTGSDTSANALFGNLQVISARALNLNPVLMAAVNSTAGVLGKMVSLQSIAVATAATGMPRDQEAKLFLFTLKHSIALTIVMGIIAMLFAYVFTGLMPQA
jgi:L-lactate transport